MPYIIKKIKDKLKQLYYKWIISSPSVEKRFTNIYKKQFWSNNKESQSGSGSTLEATEGIIDKLPEIVNKLNGKVFLDVGCGDYNWMKEIKLDCDYIGIDIVKDVVQKNKELYGNNTVSFRHLNPIESPLPRDIDIILCREVLFHLSYQDIEKILIHIKESDADWLITTSNTDVKINKDIRSGDFRNINLEKEPFNFPPPEDYILDDKISAGRVLGVWNIKHINSISNKY